jgi:centromeric protein E
MESKINVSVRIKPLNK